MINYSIYIGVALLFGSLAATAQPPPPRPIAVRPRTTQSRRALVKT